MRDGAGPARPRMWIKLARPVSQGPPELFGRAVTAGPDQWIEIRGYVGYPGEDLTHGRLRDQAWSFWENHDIDLSPIYGQEDVERVYVEPGHPKAALLRDDGEAPFEVVVAEGPPSPVRAGA